MICIKCNRESTYDSPKDLCDEHWVDWWLEGYDEFLSPEEMVKEKQELLDSIHKRYGKYKD